MAKILVTGGAGFVGSHTLVPLLEKGNEVTVIDNLSNCVKIAPGKTKPESLIRVEALTGKSIKFLKVDLRDKSGLRGVFEFHGPFEAVVHFAAMKSVGESVRSPLKYYSNNVAGNINLLEVMEEFNVKKIIFSSSSTVYGNPVYLPLDEGHPTGNCVSPYGKTKYIMEQMMKDLCTSDSSWKAIMLRYFNPIGTHPSGRIGEDPPGIPRNLIPYLCQIGVGRLETLNIFGNDYKTLDGTCVRGYIHVTDLARGHVAAMEKLFSDFQGWKAYNLGMGVGHSVLQVLNAFKRASGAKIPYVFVPQRPGDVPATYANCQLAQDELGWKAEKTLDQMCEDSWRWQSQNPFGYNGPEDIFRTLESQSEVD